MRYRLMKPFMSKIGPMDRVQCSRCGSRAKALSGSVKKTRFVCTSIKCDAPPFEAGAATVPDEAPTLRSLPPMFEKMVPATGVEPA